MKPHFLFATGLLTLAACSGGSANNARTASNNASAVNVQMSGNATVEGNLTMMPGQWEVVSTIHEMSGSALPPGALEKMKANPEQLTTTETQCWTAEHIANMGRQMISSSAEGANCSFTNERVGGGRIDVSGNCTAANGMLMHLTMSGTYTETTMEAETAVEMRETADGPVQMSVRGTGRGRRIGECPAGAGSGAEPAKQ